MTRSEAQAIVAAYVSLCEQVADTVSWPTFSTDYPLELDDVGLFLTETHADNSYALPSRGRYLRLP